MAAHCSGFVCTLDGLNTEHEMGLHTWPYVTSLVTCICISVYRYFYRYLSILPIYIYFFVTYTIIQSKTSSEMCSLHLTHPSAHTLGAVDTHTHTHTHTPGAVDTVHSGEAPARPPHVTLYKIHLFETHSIILTFTIEPLFHQ